MAKANEQYVFAYLVQTTNTKFHEGDLLVLYNGSWHHLRELRAGVKTLIGTADPNRYPRVRMTATRVTRRLARAVIGAGEKESDK